MIKAPAIPATARGRFGSTLAQYADLLAVGAPDCRRTDGDGVLQETLHVGAVFIFRLELKDGDSGALGRAVLLKGLASPVSTAGYSFGRALTFASDGQHLVVSGRRVNNTGAVHVFATSSLLQNAAEDESPTRLLPLSSEVARLTADTPSATDFGRAMAADGRYLVIAAPTAENTSSSAFAGEVYVYTLADSPSVPPVAVAAKLVPNAASESMSRFGLDVAVRGRVVLVTSRDARLQKHIHLFGLCEASDAARLGSPFYEMSHIDTALLVSGGKTGLWDASESIGGVFFAAASAWVVLPSYAGFARIVEPPLWRLAQHSANGSAGTVSFALTPALQTLAVADASDAVPVIDDDALLLGTPQTRSTMFGEFSLYSLYGTLKHTRTARISGYGFARAMCLNPSGTTLFVSLPTEARGLGIVEVYDVRSGEVSVLLGTLSPPEAFSGDVVAIAASDALVVVGATGNGTRGLAAVFLQNDTAVQDLLLPADKSQTGAYGEAVAAHGDIVVVGDADAQHVHLFRVATSGRDIIVLWTRTVSVPAPEASAVARALSQHESVTTAKFGTAVAFASDLLFVGAPGALHCGVVFVYAVSSAGFVQARAPLWPTISWSNDNFGFSLSVAEGRLAVGAPRFGEPNNVIAAGAVYLYNLDANERRVSIERVIRSPKAAEEGASDGLGAKIAVSQLGYVAMSNPRRDQIFLADPGYATDWMQRSPKSSSSGTVASLDVPSIDFRSPQGMGAGVYLGVVTMSGDVVAVAGSKVTQDVGGAVNFYRITGNTTELEPFASASCLEYSSSADACTYYGVGASFEGRTLAVAVSRAYNVGRVHVFVLPRRHERTREDRAPLALEPAVILQPPPHLEDIGAFFGQQLVLRDARLYIWGNYNRVLVYSLFDLERLVDQGSPTPDVPLIAEIFRDGLEGFGMSPAVFGDLLALGSWHGAAFVYHLGEGSNATHIFPRLVHTFRAPGMAADAADDARYGHHVAIHGRLMAVSADRYRGSHGYRAGFVDLYRLPADDERKADGGSGLNGATWIQRISPEDWREGNLFGTGLALSATRLAVAARWYDAGHPWAGCVYVYDVQAENGVVFRGRRCGDTPLHRMGWHVELNDKDWLAISCAPMVSDGAPGTLMFLASLDGERSASSDGSVPVAVIGGAVGAVLVVVVAALLFRRRSARTRRHVSAKGVIARDTTVMYSNPAFVNSAVRPTHTEGAQLAGADFSSAASEYAKYEDVNYFAMMGTLEGSNYVMSRMTGAASSDVTRGYEVPIPAAFDEQPYATPGGHGGHDYASLKGDHRIYVEQGGGTVAQQQGHDYAKLPGGHEVHVSSSVDAGDDGRGHHEHVPSERRNSHTTWSRA
jgi:hypothetical protein